MKKSPRKLRIGLDFDGVIADTAPLKRLLSKKLFQVNVPAERLKEELVIEDGLMTRAQYRKVMSLVCGSYEHGLKAKPISGAIAAIKHLLTGGNDCSVITSREGREIVIAETWLKENSLSLKVISVGYAGRKRAAVKDLDVYIDDDLHKLKDIGKVRGRLFLMDSPHNVHLDVPRSIRRVKSWDDLMTEIDLLR